MMGYFFVLISVLIWVQINVVFCSQNDHGGPKRSGSGSEKTLLNKIFVGYDPVSGRYKIDWNAATPVNCGTDYFIYGPKKICQ